MDKPFLKLLTGALATLFNVPPEFIMAIPIFWALDFISGLVKMKRLKEPFDRDKFQGQYIKMIIHVCILIGCIILSNLYDVKQFYLFGFGYVIGNEFLFSTIPNFLGNKEAAGLIRRLKKIMYNAIGVSIDDEDSV